jgi:hypothetical protein
MRVLFLTTVLPSGRRSGGEVVSHAFADALRSAGHDVRVAGWARPGDPVEPGDLLVGRRHIETSEAPLQTRLGWLARSLGGRRPFSVAKYESDGYRRIASEEAVGADVVVLDHAQAGGAAGGVVPGRPCVLIAHNVEHELYGEQAATGGGAAWVWRREARLMAAEERRLASGAAAVWTLTEPDAASFRRLGAAHVARFDVPAGLTASSAPPRARRVALLGNWTWEPNARGLRWFVREVLPLLPEDLPVEVGGAGAEWLSGVPRVSYPGRVPDAYEFLAGAQAVAIPAVAGGGIQVKTLDAIASGSWVVTTPEGLRGIEQPPPTVREAASPDAFARALAEVAAPGQEPPAGSAAAWSAERAERFAEAVAEEIRRVAAMTAPDSAKR